MDEASEKPNASQTTWQQALPASPSQLSTPIAAIILAAGKSTRMHSKLPKPLHSLCGLPVTGHVIRACREAGVSRIVVIVGHEAEAVKRGLGDQVEYALQEEQRGTGDAVRSAYTLLRDWKGGIVVLAGDVPLISPETIRTLIAHHLERRADATLLTMILDAPTGYGRILRDSRGAVNAIVEEKDASAEERLTRECNPSLYAFTGAALWNALAQIRPVNAQGEFYLTDTIGALVKAGAAVEAVVVPDAREVLGVNSRVELAVAASLLRQRLLTKMMLAGVTVTDPANTYVDVDVEVGQDTVIEPNTFLLAGTHVGEDCTIGPFARVERSTLGNSVRVLASQVVDSVLEDGVKVGPFANLRPGTHLGPYVKIGDFVETKNAIFAARAQASHLAYIGDAEVGAGTNIGAGTITCNYDGYQKHRTVIGNRAFIGSHSTLVAPLVIGDGAFVAAGSVITQDVPGDALAVARCRPTIKSGWAARYHEARKAGIAAARESAERLVSRGGEPSDPSGVRSEGTS